MAQLAHASAAPAPDSSVGGEGEAVKTSSRHSDDALASKGLDLLGQRLALLVAVAQPTAVSMAPAPDGAVGGEGDAVVNSCRHADGTLAAQRRMVAGRRVEPRHVLAVAE